MPSLTHIGSSISAEIEELRAELAMVREALDIMRAATLARNAAHEELAQLHRAKSILDGERAQRDPNAQTH